MSGVKVPGVRFGLGFFSSILFFYYFLSLLLCVHSIFIWKKPLTLVLFKLTDVNKIVLLKALFEAVPADDERLLSEE